MGTPENIVVNMSLYQMNQNQIQEFLAGLDGAVANQVADFLKDHEKVKRPRGRPAKNTPPVEEKNEEAVQAVAEEEPAKKKRGRPLSKAKKNTGIADAKEPVPAVAVEEPVKKKRGRPAKNTPKAEEKKEEPVPAVAEEVPKERKPRKEKEEVNMDLWGDLEALTFTRWIFQEGSSNKLWECADKENVTLVRYGKVGSKGTLQQKTFTDDTEAAEFLKKEILGKQK